MTVGRSIWQFNLFHTSMVCGPFQTFPLPFHIQNLTTPFQSCSLWCKYFQFFILFFFFTLVVCSPQQLSFLCMIMVKEDAYYISLDPMYRLQRELYSTSDQTTLFQRPSFILINIGFEWIGYALNDISENLFGCENWVHMFLFF